MFGSSNLCKYSSCFNWGKAPARAESPIPSGLTIVNAGTGTLSYAGAFAKSGSDGWDESGAYISEKAGVCHVEFKVSQVDKYIYCGLTDDYSLIESTKLDYSFYCTNTGEYKLYEDGIDAGIDWTAYTTDTVFKIDYDGTDVKYYVDNVLIRTVESVTKELTLMVVAYSQNASLSVTEFREG